jgi:hypothetical protein
VKFVLISFMLARSRTTKEELLDYKWSNIAPSQTTMPAQPTTFVFLLFPNYYFIYLQYRSFVEHNLL